VEVTKPQNRLAKVWPIARFRSLDKTIRRTPDPPLTSVVKEKLGNR
jgi:hypothetical protein